LDSEKQVTVFAHFVCVKKREREVEHSYMIVKGTNYTLGKYSVYRNTTANLYAS